MRFNLRIWKLRLCRNLTAKHNHFDAAIASAVDNIESAGIGAIVESVDSALVGLSDIAELTDLSRRGAVALLKDGKRGSGDLPCTTQKASRLCRIGLMWLNGSWITDDLKRTSNCPKCPNFE